MADRVGANAMPDRNFAILHAPTRVIRRLQRWRDKDGPAPHPHVGPDEIAVEVALDFDLYRSDKSAITCGVKLSPAGEKLDATQAERQEARRKPIHPRALAVIDAAKAIKASPDISKAEFNALMHALITLHTPPPPED
jgi:hypothetical protein